MALSPGSRFGPYEISDEIGAGGMGVVYRATDTALDRQVAIKVLPESMASDEERITRFDREAKTLASLNHPNIATVHGLEKSDGTTALVMELVEGPTLADRIEQGAVPADEAVGIAMQIAEALEGAHGQNIVHRDLKPANIKLKPDGTVKVLDFGIAKALEPENLTTEGQPPMLTTPATQVGVILGTAAYMSPEQARGKAVDERADIWAFGCVLYEMLTGQPAFGGEDVTITLARVVDRDTDLDSLPTTISPAVRRTIRLCLQKDVRERVADIRDVRLALKGAFETVSSRIPDTAVVARPIWQRAMPVAATAVLTSVIVGLVAWSLWPATESEPEPRPVNRFDYDLPDTHDFRNAGRPIMALSPDGRHFVYNTSSGLFLRTMGELEARLIAGTEPVLTSPEFSPDGQSVAYWNDTGELKRIAISGGAPVAIANDFSNLYGLSWEADNTILFGQPDGIYRVSANGGTPELIIPAEVSGQIYGARFLPDGDSVLFSVAQAGAWDSSQIVAQSLATGERTVLVEGGSDARYLPTGHLVYALGDGLFAVAFDSDTLTVSGGPVPLVQGVMRASADLTGAANYGVSADGTLVYVSGSAGTVQRSLFWVGRDGREDAINMPRRGYLYAQLAPDGTRVAVTSFDEGGDIWIWDLERETLQRLTFDPTLNLAPIWSPDSRSVAFSQQVNGKEEIFWRAADGSGMAEPLTEGSAAAVMPNDFLPDGTALLYTQVNAPRDVWMVPVDGPATAGMPLLAGPANESSAAVSPDGRWLAYQSDESGRDEIYVRPYPDVQTGRWQISTEGGTSPVWSRDGRELFYFVAGATDTIMAVPVESETSFRPGTPETLSRGDYPFPSVRAAFYDVSLDGQRLLMIKNTGGADEGERPQVIIVENWFEEIERLVPTE